MKTINTILVAVALLAVSATGSAQEAAPNKASKSRVYIVQVKGDPVLAYEGGANGLAATRPAKGQKLDPNSASVRQYAQHLDLEHAAVLDSVGGGRMIYNYRYALNGFAAMMTPDQAEALRNSGKVLNVWEDEILQPQTNRSPYYIELTEGGEAWSKGYVGEDIVIGVIDSGIQPDHPSLADVPTPKKGNKGKKIPYGPPPASWTGTGCDFGSAVPNDTPFECNNKLLKAQAFNASFLANATPINGEFLTARDSDGHGTHTMTTAGGNYGVPAQIDGEDLGKVSGIAPRARLAAYKVCYDAVDPNNSGCYSSDSAAAIDQAVIDGVDVINFSIGGSATNFNGADDIAFLFAADAGVWVATSNGNAGPGAGTVGTPSGVPWITAVGASQDDHVFGTGVIVSSPVDAAGTYAGIEGSGPVTLADTGDITASIVPGMPADGCAPLSNAADVSGNIALIIRGGCGFINKYDAAAAAGAQAIIVYNDGTAPDRIDPIGMGGLETATIPGEMIGFFDGDGIATVAATETVTGTIGPSISIPRVNRIAGFSSRGPNNGAPDIIKPDVAAPGVDILAGETLFPNDSAGGGQYFQSIDGTSMASPHVAGAFAILKQAHPDWTPAIARSALMTTARWNLLKTFGDEPADPFDIGAGEIMPTKALNPGLAYDVGLFEYAAFTCANNVQIFTQGTCDFLTGLGISTDGSDLNLPSIGIGELAGSQTITRTVTSVANNNGNKKYCAEIDAPAGIQVDVSPWCFRLRKGETASYQLTFSATADTVLNEWAFGSISWFHGNQQYGVRSPIAIFPVAFSAPPGASGDGTDGSTSFDVSFGYSGDYSATMDGLAEGTNNMGSVDDFIPSDPNSGISEEFFVVPAGTTLARFAMYDEDVGTGAGTDDIDLVVLDPDGNFVGSSGGPTSAEEVNLTNPAPGTYTVLVFDFLTAPGDTTYSLFNYNLDGNDLGNSTVTGPAAATAGTSATVDVSWTGLAAGTRYLGIVSHSDGSSTLGQTEVDVDTR